MIEYKQKLNLYFLFYFYIFSITSISSGAKKNKNASPSKVRQISQDDISVNIPNTNRIFLLGGKEYNYITNAINEEGELFFESSSYDKAYERYVTGLYGNGRFYFEDSLTHIYSFSDKIQRRTSNSIVINSNNKKYLLSICYDDGYFEFLDLTSLNNNLLEKSKKTLDNSIESNNNPLFKLKNDGSIFFGYFHEEGIFGFYTYYLILIKCSIVVENGVFRKEISKINSNIKTSFSFIISCFETTNYINCFYANKDKELVISIFDTNLNFIYDSRTEETSDVASDSELFRKGIFLKKEISAYIYYIKDSTRPKLLIKYFSQENGNNLYNLLKNIDIIKLDGNEDLHNNCDKNDIMRIHDNRFVFISSLSSNKYFLILLFDLYNDDKSLAVRKYLFNLEGYNMNTNLRIFHFKNFIGFSYCYGSKVSCAYRILSYGNTTDNGVVNDILGNLDSINPLSLENNIQIENNIFGLKFIGTKIISIPEKGKTGLLLSKFKDKSEIMENDIIINDSIFFSFIANTEVIEGIYTIEFAAVVGEIDFETFNSEVTSCTIYGVQKNQEPFFSPSNFTGRIGHFKFSVIKKEEFKCHPNCYSCDKNMESEDEQNCITCIDDYYFVENSKKCFKDPIGYYLNENKIYSSCHHQCEYCEGKELNESYMNCISCREKNYLFYPKNKNCLNCPKYVNFEQTECINEIPDGYYLSDPSYGIIEKCNEYCSKCSNAQTLNNMNCDYCIEGYYLKLDDNNIKNCFPYEDKIPSNYYTKKNEPNIYYKCYELCGSCDKEGNESNMNCLTCIDNNTYEYDSQSKNCVQKVICKYNYYYDISDNDNTKSKICLPEGVLCPEVKPYEISDTKECVSSCSYDDLIGLKCKLNNKNISIEQINEYLQDEIENNAILINQILSGNFTDLTVSADNIIYEITTSLNQQNKIGEKINDGISTIDLADCEDILKKENNISENISLIILKYDIKSNQSISAQIEYGVYNPLTKKKLNLGSCHNTSISVYVPINIDENLLITYKEANSKGYDLFDPENKFYVDICTPFTSPNGTDIILADRENDILNKSGSLCEIDCEYMGFDTEIKRALCQCPPKTNIFLETTNSLTSIKRFGKIHKNLKKRLNYKILKCIKLLFNLQNFIGNYGFYIMSSIIFLFLILAIMNFITSGAKLRVMCSKIVEERKNFIKKFFNKEDDILPNILDDSKNIGTKRASKILVGAAPKRKSINIKSSINPVLTVNKPQRKRKSVMSRFIPSNNNSDNNDKIIIIKIVKKSQIGKAYPKKSQLHFFKIVPQYYQIILFQKCLLVKELLHLKLVILLIKKY